MKILLAVDGSPCSNKAVQYVADSVKWYADTPQITVLHVNEMAPAVESARAKLGSEAVDNHLKEQTRKALEPVENLFRERNIPFEPVCIGGDVAEQICAQAEKSNTDLLVMGSRGLGAVSGLLMGSVTNKVLAKSKVPVVVIR